MKNPTHIAYVRTPGSATAKIDALPARINSNREVMTDAARWDKDGELAHCIGTPLRLLAVRRTDSPVARIMADVTPSDLLDLWADSYLRPHVEKIWTERPDMKSEPPPDPMGAIRAAHRAAVDVVAEDPPSACGNCLFYLRHDPLEPASDGLCRRYPPVPVVAVMGMPAQIAAVFPGMTPSGWCGEWQE